MGESTLTGTEFARVTKSYSSYSLSWIGSYALLSQDPVANTSTIRLYGSMYTGSSSNVRSANSTDVEQVNGVTISPPTPAAYRYSSSMEYGFSVNSGYSLFGYTDKVVTHNADGTFPTTSISIFSRNYHHSSLSSSGNITGIASIDRAAPTVAASTSGVGMYSFTLSASSNVNCNKWEYQLNSGSWVTFSTSNTTSVSYTITGLSAATAYTVNVRATKTYNGVTGTKATSATTLNANPPTVSVSSSAITINSFKITATANDNCNKWEYSLNSGTWTTFSTTNGTSASQTFTGLSSNTAYSVNIRATRTYNGVTGTKSISVTTLNATPPTVTVTTSDVTMTSFTFSASANDNCNKWEYQLNSGSWTTFSTTNGTSASRTITGLTANTAYTVNVRATRTYNGVTGTKSASVTTLNANAPTITLSTSSVTANSFTFTATTGDNCNKWEYSTNGGSSWTTWSTTNTTSQSKSLTGLNPATSYTVTVRCTRTYNGVTGTKSATVSTLGYSVLTAASDINVDNSTTLTFTAYDANFYHSVQFAIGSTVLDNRTIGKVGGTGTRTYTSAYTFPANVLPTTTSATVTCTLRTYTASSYSEASYIGNTTITFTLTVPNTDTYKPSVSIECTPYNTNEWIASKNAYVGGYSKINIAVTASAGSGSTLSSTVVSPTSTIVSGTTYRTNEIQTAGSKTVSVTVTDKRGRTKTATQTITFKAYSSPTFSTFTVQRGIYADSTWTAQEDGAHIRAEVVGSVSLTDINNQIVSTTVKCGNDNATIVSGNYYIWTNTTAESAYQVSASITDEVGITTSTGTTVSSIAVPFNLNTTMPAAAFGMIAQSRRKLELAPNWSLVANGKQNTMAYMPYSSGAYGVGSTAGYARIATITVTGNNCSSPIEFDIQRRWDSRSVRFSVLFVNEGNTDPALQSFYYDSYAGTWEASPPNAFMVKTATSVWDVFVQKSTQGDNIGVTTYISPHAQDRCTVTYSQSLLNTVPPDAVMATQYPIDNVAKQNRIDYLPYSWSTDAGAGSQGYARIATLTIKRGWVNGPITFKVYRRNDYVPMEIYLFYAGASSTDPTIETFYVNRSSSGRTNIAKPLPVVFATKIDTSIWDIYVEKTEANEELTVFTEISKGLQDCIDITYVANFISSLPQSYQLATGLPLVNEAKHNTMAYMPYSWHAYGVSGSYGWARIARVDTKGNTWVQGSITFEITRLVDYAPFRVYLAFEGASNTDPAISRFYRDGNPYVAGNAPTVFIYKVDTHVWDIYIQKVGGGDDITVRVYPDKTMQDKAVISFSDNLLTSVPSGAITADYIPLTMDKLSEVSVSTSTTLSRATTFTLAYPSLIRSILTYNNAPPSQIVITSDAGNNIRQVWAQRQTVAIPNNIVGSLQLMTWLIAGTYEVWVSTTTSGTNSVYVYKYKTITGG